MRRAQAGPTQHRILASIPTGYPINPAQEWISLIVPQATTNLFLNPSFETNTSNWTQSGNGSGSSLARSTSQQCRGAYSGALTIGTSGTYVQIVGPTIVSTTVYALSFHVRAPNGRPVALSDLLAVYNGTTNPFGRLEYIGNGWWRASVVFTATATTAPGIRILGSAGQVWYVDACQLEASSVVTTYCDGDEHGLLPFESPLPFRWNGTPHASTSSRSGATRAGGIVRELSYYGLTLVSIQGLGAGPIENVYTPLGNAPGAIYQTADQAERTFTIGGRFEATDHGLLSRRRGALRRDLSASLSGLAQPLRLILQKYRDVTAIGDQVYADCSYAGGLEGDDASLYSEDVAIQFVQYQPDLVRVVSSGSVLDFGDTSASGWAHFYDLNGTFTAVSGLNNTVESNACIWAPITGLFILGGSFTAPGTRVISYNPATGSTGTLGSGLSATVRALLETPDGRIYAGGDQFTISAATGYIAYWNGSAWALVGGAGTLPGPVYAMAYDPSNQRIYLGVRDTGGSNAELWMYNIATDSVSNVADGTGGFIYDLAIDPQQRILYIAGSFTNFDGVAEADAIAMIDLVNAATTGTAVGGAANDTVWSLALDAQRRLIAAGEFTTIGGITAPGFARWNGTRWEELEGLEANTASSIAPYVAYDETRDVLWALSSADPADDPRAGSGVTYALIEYQGSTPTIPGANISAENIVAAAPSPLGTLFGRSNSATIRYGGSATASNDGTSATPPIILVDADTLGFSTVDRFWQVRNITSNQRIDLFNLYGIPRSDRVIIDMRIPRMLSRQRGDVTFGFGGATAYAFALLPGSNRIQALASNDNFTAAVMYWYPRYLSFDDIVPGVE